MRAAVLAFLTFVHPPRQEEIRLLVRADDLGAAHAINEASIKACTDGIARSVEIIAPGPWLPEADDDRHPAAATIAAATSIPSAARRIAPRAARRLK